MGQTDGFIAAITASLYAMKKRDLRIIFVSSSRTLVQSLDELYESKARFRRGVMPKYRETYEKWAEVYDFSDYQHIYSEWMPS